MATTTTSDRRTARKTAGAQKQTKPAQKHMEPEARKEPEGSEGRKESRGALSHVPVPHVSVARVPVPYVSLPRPSLRMPVNGRPGQILWLGGLAAVAAFGVIDWPVAGAVAVGTYVAERRAKAASARGSEPEDHPENHPEKNPEKHTGD